MILLFFFNINCNKIYEEKKLSKATPFDFISYVVIIYNIKRIIYYISILKKIVIMF